MKGAGSSPAQSPSTSGSAAADETKSNGLHTMRRKNLVILEGGRRVGLKRTPQKYSPMRRCEGPTYLHTHHHAAFEQAVASLLHELEAL